MELLRLNIEENFSGRTKNVWNLGMYDAMQKQNMSETVEIKGRGVEKDLL